MGKSGEKLNKLSNLSKKRQAQKALEKQLAGSLLIEGLWPDVYDHGTCNTEVRGNPYKPQEMVFRIIAGNGDFKDFPLAGIPVELWKSYSWHVRQYEPRAWGGLCKAFGLKG